MQHLEDGIIHALIDEELEPDERAATEEHLATCASCTARLKRQRTVTGEADELLVVLDDEPVAQRAYSPPGRDTVSHGPPVVLVPAGAIDAHRRRRRIQGLAAAAMLVVASGAGWFALQGPPPEEGTLPAAAESRVAASDPEVSTEQAAAPSATSGFADTNAASAPMETDQSRRDLADGSPNPRTVPPPANPERTASNNVPSERPTAAARQQSQTPAQDRAVPASARDEAARRERVNAAAEVSRATEPAPAAAAPVPALVTAPSSGEPVGRIGLDVAERMLGGPVHVIDGLRVSEIRSVSGRDVRGADRSRNVVRVIYRGPDGGEIFLDQQRSTGGDGDPVFGAAGWQLGTVRLRLTGDVTNDSLNTLVGKVR